MMEPRSIVDLDPPALDRLLRRGRPGDPDVATTVGTLIEEVRRGGDEALRDQARRLDGVTLEGIEVPRSAWTEALEGLDPEIRASLTAAAASIRLFHDAQRPTALVVEPVPGVVLGRRPDALRRVGVYAPGGRAVYPSSVLMGVVPAKVAGVEAVIVCSPPGPDGRPAPLVMAACAVAGADRLFAVGGAGAVAALAVGTEAIPAVDRIVGPGNVYVTEAKRQLSATVGIDSPAGPSELLVLADGGADPVTIAMEMLAQAEHDPDAAALLVATDVEVARAAARELAARAPAEPRADVIVASLAANGAILVADSLDQALDFAARYAPEHLLLLVDEPRAALERVRCAGTVFLGPRSSVAFGDYATGANHVLPTGGMARSFSGLSVDDFVRWTTWQEVDPEATAELAAVAGTLARAEGLPAHAAAAAHAAAHTATHAPAHGGEPVVLPRLPYRSLDLYDPGRPPVQVDLSANTNLWGGCPAALESLAAAAAPTTYPTPYAEELKAAIAEAWGLSPSQVVTGCGSDDLIDSALRAFCEPGAVVAFPAPTFPMAQVFARMNDSEPRPVPMGPDGTLTDEALRTLAAAEVVYLCRPNNPTGAMVPRARVEELLARSRGLVLLDEAYGEYAGESLLEPALASGRGVVLRTFSKAYGLAGLRVGYALGPEPLVRIIERSRGPYKVGGWAERAAVATIREGGAWVTDIVRQTVLNREALATALRERGLHVMPSHANFLLVAADHRGWARAVRAALLERGILVRAFPDLVGMLDGAGDAVRVTVGPEPVMVRFLAALDEALLQIQEVA